jgi:hypothetical protein
MRVLVIGRPRFQVPPEQFAGMVQGALDWFERHRGSIIISGGFPAGGGFAVLDVPDVETLNRLALEWPLTPVSETQVEPFMDGEAGLRELLAALQRMGGAGGAAAGV